MTDPTSEAQQANTSPPILLITVDCLRADFVDIYDTPQQVSGTTPSINALAERPTAEVLEGYANSPGTRWAMQTIHTGMYTTRIEGHGDPGSVPTLPGQLTANGYRTGAFAFNGNFSTEYNYHRNFDTFRGVKHYADSEDDLVTIGKQLSRRLPSRLTAPLSQLYNSLYLPAKDRLDTNPITPTDKEVVDDAIDWIRSQRQARDPFFCWVHLMDAHAPLIRREAFKSEFDADPWVFNPNRNGDLTDPTYKRTALRSYAAAIRSADEQIGRLLDVAPEECITIVTADHGEDFYDFLGYHDPSVYSVMTHVPMVIDQPADRISDLPTQLQHVDLAPTIMEMVDLPVAESWDGRARTGAATDPEYVFLQINDIEHGVGVRSNGIKLVRDRMTESDQLVVSRFGHEDQPVDHHDHPEVYAELSSRLDEHIESTFTFEYDATSPWESTGGREGLNETIEENLEDLGYLS